MLPPGSVSLNGAVETHFTSADSTRKVFVDNYVLIICSLKTGLKINIPRQQSENYSTIYRFNI